MTAVRNLAIALATCFLACATPARAVVLNVGSAGPVSIGQEFAVEISAAGIVSPTALPIGNFTLPLDYDPALALLVDVQFGTMLNDGDPLASFRLVDTPVPGRVEVSEISFLPSDFPITGDGLLARVIFQALAVGNAGFALDIGNVVLGDGLGDPLPVEAGTPRTSVEVLLTVPTPGVLPLLAAGTLALFSIRRRTA